MRPEQGVQHIYLLIFSDREVSLSARLTAPAPSISAEDASIEVSWTRLGNPEVSDPIYLGLGRLPIRSDVVACLTLIPDDYELVSFQAVTAQIVVAANWVSTDDGDREAKGMLGVDSTF